MYICPYIFNMSNCLISICIPAYKRLSYLKRLLDSIAAQTFKDLEVIITDDSPDDSVYEMIQQYRDRFSLQYYKNQPALGTPANWNSAISKATGEWIKLMHDDDWFATNTALQQFADNTTKGSRFIFCSYARVTDESGKTEVMQMPPAFQNSLIAQPLILFASNHIGPPSVTMIHKSIAGLYDERMKWRVDIDLYIQVLLAEKSFTYIKDVLVNMGVNAGQVTNGCFENPYVELPEGYMLIEKYGLTPLSNIVVYDAWWRLLRNMQINSPEKLSSYGNISWPLVIVNITKHLGRVPAGVLKIGAFSKMFMALSFITNKKN